MTEFDVSQYFNRLRQNVEQYVARNGASARSSSRAIAAFNAIKGISLSPSAVQSIGLLGLPDDVLFLRVIYWKLLLRYLPFCKDDWPSVLAEKRSVYFSAVENFIKKPSYIGALTQAVVQGSFDYRSLTRIPRPPALSSEAAVDLLSGDAILYTDSSSAANRESPQQQRVSEASLSREGLSVNPLRSMTVMRESMDVAAFGLDDQLFKSDFEVLDQINKDVFRTRGDVELFSLALPTAPSQYGAPSCLHQGVNQNQRAIDMLTPRYHVDVFGRILFVYSKLHPSLKYTQGMNELLAPIFFVIFADPLLEDIEQAEADTFFCFSALLQMNGQFELFCKMFDQDHSGVLGRVKHLGGLLEYQDPGLSRHFERLKLDIQFFALRWILLLLTQEFSLPHTMQLWDSLLADGYDGQSSDAALLYFLCLAILERLRGDLMKSDFSACMKVLQSLPPQTPGELVARAIVLRQGLESARRRSGPTLGLRSRRRLSPAVTTQQRSSSTASATPSGAASAAASESLPESHISGRDGDVVAKMKRYYQSIVSSSEAKDVKEMAANIGSVGADYAKSAVQTVHDWLNNP